MFPAKPAGAALAAFALLGASHAAAEPMPQTQAPAVAENAIMATMLHVADLDRSLPFYTDGLGMVVKARRGPETILGFGNDPTAPSIILLSGAKAGSQPIVLGSGFARLVLRMNDLPALATRLRSHGIATTPIRNVGQGYRMMMATDPNGYPFELVERIARQETSR